MSEMSENDLTWMELIQPRIIKYELNYDCFLLEAVSLEYGTYFFIEMLPTPTANFSYLNKQNKTYAGFARSNHIYPFGILNITVVIAPSTPRLLAVLGDEVIYSDGGFSIVDGRDKDGYDKGGRDRDGFDRGGWSAEGFHRGGGRFSGRIVGGKRDGPGVYTSSSGDNIIGSYTDDKLEGFAVRIGRDGSRYFGHWKNDACDGPGVLVRSDGGRENQTWVSGTRTSAAPHTSRIVSDRFEWVALDVPGRSGLAEGRGSAISMDARYRISSGTFKAGRLVEGTLVYPDGTSCEGTFEGDLLVSGKRGFPDGSIFTGTLREQVPYGKGRLESRDGSVYEGDFAAGQAEGEGNLLLANGDVYEGSFHNGLPHGMGIYKTRGSIERCEFMEGRRIDQVYLMRLEREKLAEENRSREERQRAAEEAAERAKVERERRRQDQERLAAEKARKEKSQNGFFGLVGGLGMAGIASSMGLSDKAAIDLGVSTAKDISQGTTSNTNKTLDDISRDQRTGRQTGTSTAPPASGGPAPITTGINLPPPVLPGLKSQPPETGTSSAPTASRGSMQSSQGKKLKAQTISYNGKPNDSVTWDINSLHFGKYKYPDGSWFELKPNGRGEIHYSLDANGNKNLKGALPITWGVQLTEEGYLLDKDGYLLLYIIIKTDKGDKAELLELGNGHASGWMRE